MASGPIQFSSVVQSCPTLCDWRNRRTPGLPAHHQLPEFTQTHFHPVSDATQPSHPLSSPSPPAPNPSQQQSLFQWVNSSHEVAFTSWQIDGRKSGNSNRFYFGGLQNHCRLWLQSWNEKSLVSWKKSYNKPRKHIKKKINYFADKGPHSQSYGFSSSHVWMWELDHK